MFSWHSFDERGISNHEKFWIISRLACVIDDKYTLINLNLRLELRIWERTRKIYSPSKLEWLSAIAYLVVYLLFTSAKPGPDRYSFTSMVTAASTIIFHRHLNAKPDCRYGGALDEECIPRHWSFVPFILQLPSPFLVLDVILFRSPDRPCSRLAVDRPTCRVRPRLPLTSDSINAIDRSRAVRRES